MQRFAKKLLLLIFTVGIVFSAQAPASAEAAISMPPYFTDVPVNSWYYDEVMDITASRYMEGVGNHRFSPKATMSRAMMITILGRMALVDTTQYQEPTGFSDVPDNTWYTPYVSWAVMNNITNGTSDTSFSPTQPVTREQMATFFARYVETLELTPVVEPESTTPFRDQDEISNFARDAVTLMQSVSIIEGKPDGSFMPKSTATRAEAATVISRFTKAYGIHTKKSSYPDMRYIIHGSGTIDEYITPNAKESLDIAYKNGNRTIEIDFNFTSDGHLICVHDLNYKVIPDTPNYKNITLEEFLNCKIYGKFTPMDIHRLAEYMQLHPDLYIVTDVKGDNLLAARLIAEAYPELKSQFIIQIYAVSEYDTIHDLGFPYIIYTLYRTSWDNIVDPNYLMDFVASSDLLGISVSSSLLDYSNITNILKQTGLPIYVHTINESDEIKTCFDMGIYGVYTDNTIHS